tara:strand:+ start:12172 stop:23358 length:11187 start_codon:yes stop_codon:yes gene_type:complete
MAYLNPNTIVLDDFSTPEYVQADFLIENAGTMNFLEIEIDRTTSTVTKSTIDNITWGNNASLMLSNDLNIPNYITLNSNHQNSMLHTSFLTETSPQSLIKGIVFTICVKNIFNLDDSQISNIDFVQDNDRLNSVFFDNDPTTTLVNDLLNASQNDFNRTLTSDGTNEDEYAYWDTRIGPSNQTIIFVDDDKMYSFYGLRLKLIPGTTPIISGTSISDVGNQITTPGFYNNDGHELYFIMSWNVQITGFGEGNASSGPKQNWNVEFLDINNGDSLYNDIIKTDSNGSFLIPQHAINAEVFEISVTCIDSSGFDTLTDEQSEIGENFTAIGTSETGLISQATPLSSVLAEGFKETGNLNLASYKNLKSSYESAFGISDININPYDTEVDDTNATINSSKILEIEALTDGMRTVLSENSSMSRSNIQKKIRKAISQKLTSPNIDFTNTTIISDMIQTAATEVVDNGTNIVTLKNKATGLSSSVNYIKTTFHSHSSSNRNTRLFELHKSLTSVKNTFKASPNFNTNITSSITNHRNILNVSKFNVPSRSLWKRKWDVRFVSNPPVFINQDATYTYTPIAKGSVQQHTPIIVIFKPSWLNWDGKTLSGTPDNSHVGSHSVILKSIEDTRERNQPFAITVNNINDTPTFTNSPLAIIDIAYQPTYSYTPTVNDIDVGDSLTITCETDLTNSWLSWNGTILQGSPNYSQIGNYSIHLRVSDNGSPQRSGNIHFTIEVISTNQPPFFTTTPSAIIDEDSEYNYTPTASDVNLNDTLNFSVPTKPSWLNWNGTKLNGIPTNNDIGNHNVTIRVNDGIVHVDQSFIISVNAVNDAPIFTSNPPAIVDEDTLYTYTPTASDEEGDSLTFSLHASNAKGPAWLNWDGTTLSGTPTNDNIGNTTVTIRVSDGAINVDQSFTITVNNVNDAPVFTTTPNATVYTDEDTLYTYTPTATDVDVGDTVSINLHSKSEKGPTWLNWDGTTLSGTPTNDNVGNTTVTIRASDGAVHVDQSFTITVNNVNDPPVFTSTPSNSVIDNTTYSYTPTAIDVDLNYSLSFSIVTKPNFLTWNGTTLSGVPSNNTGDHNIIIRVTDGIVNVDQTFTLEVNRYIFETRTSLVTAVNAWTTNSTTAAAIYGPINNWDVSQVTNMSQLFKDKTTFNDNISEWDVSNVTHMESMFNSATSFNKPLNDWNVSNVENMKGMFCVAKLFNQNISGWNVSKVTTMQNMFYIAEVFNNGGNSSITNWNVSKVTAMASMFREAKAFDQPIGNWNVSIVNRMDYMFKDNTSFNKDIGNWNVSNVVLFNKMFHSAEEFNQDIGDWNMSSATNMNHMFRYANDFDQDISSWNVPSSRVTVGLDTYASAGTNHSDSLLFNSSSLYYFKINRTPLTNSNIQTAVNTWISDTSILEYGGHISTWDVSQVTNMGDLFKDKTSFNEDISGWDVSNVTNMKNMLDDAAVFNQPIGNWNVSKVTSLQTMFYRAVEYNQPLNNWNVSNAISLRGVFFNAEKFNQPLNNWNISSATTIRVMFRNALVFDQDISNWNPANINGGGNNDGWLSWGDTTGHSDAKFRGSSQYYFTINVTPLTDSNIQTAVDSALNNGNSLDEYGGHISDWDVSQVSNMQSLFRDKTSFNEDISNWNVSNVVNMQYMFSQTSFNQPLNNWNVSKVTKMDNMLYGTPFNSLIESWNVSKVTDMAGMFTNASQFNQSMNNWNVSNLGHMNSMFENATSFNQNLNLWNVSKVTFMGDMFKGATSFNQPLNNWNVSKVTDMHDMFNGATSFNQSLHNWNVSKVKTMQSMFYNAKIFDRTLIWDVSNVTNMKNMFYKAEVFNNNGDTSINNWNLSKATRTDNMFREAKSFNQPIGNWDVSKVTTMDYMFNNAHIFNQDIGGWNVSNVATMKNMFHSANEFNNGGQSSISNWDVSNVTNMKHLFRYAGDFDQDISGWNVSSVTTGSDKYASAGTNHSNDLFNDSSLYYFTVNQVAITNSNIQTAINEWISDPETANTKYGGNINTWDTSTVTNMDSLFENKTSFAGGANIFGIGDDLPANFGEIGGTHVNNGVPKAILYWAYDQNDGNIIVSTEDNAASLKMVKISQDGTIASVIFEQPLNNNQYIDLTHPVRVANITTVRSAEDLINVYNNPLQAGSHIDYTFEKGTGFDDITFGDNSLASWNVSNVTSMQNMFKGATDFNSDISGWDVSNVNNMQNMFEDATSFDQSLGSSVYVTIDADFVARDGVVTSSGGSDPSFTLTQNSLHRDNNGVWNRGNQFLNSTRISVNCKVSWRHDASNGYNVVLFSKDPNTLDWSTHISVVAMAQTYNHLPTTQDGLEIIHVKGSGHGASGYWTNADYTILQAQGGTLNIARAKGVDCSIETIDGQAILTIGSNVYTTLRKYNNTNGWYVGFWAYANANRSWTNVKVEERIGRSLTGSGWDVSNVTEMTSMFENASSYNQPISSWNVSKVTNMDSMFENASSFNKDISGWDVSAIDITSKSLYTFGLNSGHSSTIFNGTEFLEAGGGVTIGNVHDCKLKIIGSPHQNGYGGKYVIIVDIKLQNVDTGEYLTLTNPTVSSFGWGGVEADKAIDGNLTGNGWHSADGNNNGSSIENIWWKADVQLDLSTSYKVYVTGRHRTHNESSPVIVQIWNYDETTIFVQSPILKHYTWGSNTQVTDTHTFDNLLTIRFDIINNRTATKAGVDISDSLTATLNGQTTFILKTLNPSSSDFYSNEYMIEWEDDPVSYQHGGYYLTYNGLNNFDSNFMLNGGPIWWWYLNEGTYTYPQIKWTTSGSYWPNSVFGNQAGWDAFRKKHTLKFKFIDNTNWRITYIINGSEYSQTIPTYGGWTFSDKESIEVRYRMSTAYETGANPFTSPHTLTFYDSIPTNEIVLGGGRGSNTKYWIALYRKRTSVLDGNFIDIDSIKAYNQKGERVYPRLKNSFGTDAPYPMSNAIAIGWATTETSAETTVNGFNHQYFWSTNGQNHNNYSGGWMMFLEKPYRIDINMRSGSNSRKPHFMVGTSGIAATTPWDNGNVTNPSNISDIENEWEVLHEFNDSSNPSFYSIHIGGISHISSISQTPDLWYQYSDIMASENLFDGDAGIQWHGISSGNYSDEIQLEFVDPIKLKSIKSWFTTYTNLADWPSGINIDGSHDGTNFVRLLTNGAMKAGYNDTGDLIEDTNFVETQIPLENRGYYKYYNFHLLDGNQGWTRCGEMALRGEYVATPGYELSDNILTSTSGWTPEYTMPTPNVMLSNQSSAIATNSGWSRNSINFQTASNNYSRVDFITSGSRFCVGLVKENLSSVTKQLLTSKAHFGNGNTTHWQFHSNAVNILSETGYDSWNNHGSYAQAVNKVCSIISTDYWEENPFGTDPTNIGTINANQYPNSPISSWGLDDDGYIILELRGHTIGDGYNYYIKIDKQGNMKEGSSYYKAAGGAGTQYAPTSLSDLISRYNSGNGGQIYSFNKATNFPGRSTIRFIIDGTLVRTITHSGPPGGYYINALINGQGHIEFLPNPYMYFDCIRVPKVLNTNTLVAYASDAARMNNPALDDYTSTSGGYILITNSSSNPNHKKYSSSQSINHNHNLLTMYAFNHYTINFNATLTQSEGYCIAVWVYHTASGSPFYYGDEILSGSPGRMHINNNNKFMSTDLIEINYYYLFVVQLAPSSSTYKYYYGQYDANMNPVGKLQFSNTSEGSQYTNYNRTSMATYNTAHNTDKCYYLESMAFRGDWNYDSINNYLYYRNFKYGTGRTRY